MSIKVCSDIGIVNIDFFSFPGGERQVNTIEYNKIKDAKKLIITLSFDNGSNDIMDLLLLVNAAHNLNNSIDIHLIMLYVPYGRQDRIANAGEAHSLKVFTSLINSCGFSSVEIADPHSDVTEALLKNLTIIPQHEMLNRALVSTNLKLDSGKYVLVSPDGGALKKIFTCSKALGGIPVIRADKERDTATGKITGTVIVNPELLKDKRAVIVDDICDGGYTFIKLAEEIRKINPTKAIVLYVTHGIFSKGLDPFKGIIDLIICPNILNKEVKALFNGKVMVDIGELP